MSALGHRIRQENIRCRNIPEILCPRSAEKDHAMEYLYSLSERQRGNYWKLEDKRLLIDTIVVRKLGLPKVVLSWDVATNH